MKKRFIFIFFLIAFLDSSFAQEDSVRIAENQALILNDTIIVPQSDTIYLVPAGEGYETISKSRLKSQLFFDSLQSKSKQSKVTDRLFKLLVDYRKPEDVLKADEPVRSETYFEDLSGKRIRNINYVNVDLFGGSVRNTEKRAGSEIQKFANQFHIKTQFFVIRKHLLFKTGDTINEFKMADSERIIRSLPFIRDVRIETILIDSLPEQVDVLIVVRDRLSWSLNTNFSGTNKYNVGLRNNNVAGTANEVSGAFRHYDIAVPENGYETSLIFRNIQKSFIDFTIYAENTYQRERYGILISKNFLSPLQKYNGEILIDRVTQNIYPPEWDTIQYFERNRLDSWLSRSFTIDTRLNFGLSGRYVNHQFFERPGVLTDSNEVYHNRQTVLSSIFLSRTNFYKTRNILSFNITEDVPVGFISSVVFGRNWSEFRSHYYSGLSMGAGTFTKLGYLKADIRVGTFFSKVENKNMIFNSSLGYFSPLIKLGRSHLRTFIRANYFRSRDLSIPFSRSLINPTGIRDLTGINVQGNNAFNGTFETVLFLPSYFYGFQFAPFFYSDLGIVEENRISEPYNNLYNNIGLGLRTKNENLIFDALEFRISYFPNYPENGESFTFHFAFTKPIFFRSFNVTKPIILAYD